MSERCIEWKGRRFPNGYGHIKSRPLNRAGYLYAHRWAYEKFYGPIPGDRIVMHACDNKPCINPLHLRLGTIRENTLDAVSKGRCRQRKQTRCGCGRPYTTTLVRGARAGQSPSGSKAAWYCRRCVTERRRRRG